MWSPDGTKIAFTSSRFGNFEILVMNADGSNVTRRTNDPGWDFGPSWSPDGTKIAFATNRHGNFEIFSINANGTGGLNRLTNHPASDTQPAWGANGKILFTSTRAGFGHIFVMNANGSGVVQLSNRGFDITGIGRSEKIDQRAKSRKPARRAATSCRLRERPQVSPPAPGNLSTARLAGASVVPPVNTSGVGAGAVTLVPGTASRLAAGVIFNDWATTFV